MHQEPDGSGQDAGDEDYEYQQRDASKTDLDITVQGIVVHFLSPLSAM